MRMVLPFFMFICHFSFYHFVIYRAVALGLYQTKNPKALNDLMTDDLMTGSGPTKNREKGDLV